MMLKIVAISILIGLCVLNAGALAADADTHILFYFIGGDLEEDSDAASRDLSELLEADLPEHTLLFVLLGGARRWANPAIPGETVSVFAVRDSELQQHAISPDADCGSSDTLTEYLCRYATAPRNILILWGHGINGRSVGSLTLWEIEEGIRHSGVNIEIIGFDACAMATLETFWILDGVCQYAVAASEEEALGGWAHKSWLAYCDIYSEELCEKMAKSVTSGLWLPTASVRQAVDALNELFYVMPSGGLGESLLELSENTDDDAISEALRLALRGQTLRTAVYTPEDFQEAGLLDAIGEAYGNWVYAGF